MASHTSSRTKPIQFRLLNFATFATFLAWLAVACYALSYLISR